MLQDNNITTTAKSIAALMLIALDNGVITREEVLRNEPKQESEKKPRGRPRKYPPKEVDPNKVVDPKYHRLRTIRTNPISVKLTRLMLIPARQHHNIILCFPIQSIQSNPSRLWVLYEEQRESG